MELNDACARLDQAEVHAELLRESFAAWLSSGRLQLVCERDPEFVRYMYGVLAHEHPTRNLGLTAGEVFNNLRSALDYVAFQVFLDGGGNPTDRQARSVAFPIVREEAKWAKAVTSNVPHAWPEAVDQLKVHQPFCSAVPHNAALPALQSMGATDKHRGILLCATAVVQVGADTPALGDGEALTILMAQPGPVVEVGTPGWLGAVARHVEGTDPLGSDGVARWSEGFELRQPPDPTVTFEFRADDGAAVEVASIPALIEHTRRIVESFCGLEPPGHSAHLEG